MVLSMPVLLILGGVLLYFMRSDGLRLGPTLVAVLLGAQISGTVLATEVNGAISAVGHLLGAVLS
jgi:hypothetical protein